LNVSPTTAYFSVVRKKERNVEITLNLTLPASEKIQLFQGSPNSSRLFALGEQGLSAAITGSSDLRDDFPIYSFFFLFFSFFFSFLAQEVMRSPKRRCSELHANVKFKF
jgi:preprotein translocase subunit SecY